MQLELLKLLSNTYPEQRDLGLRILLTLKYTTQDLLQAQNTTDRAYKVACVLKTMRAALDNPHSQFRPYECAQLFSLLNADPILLTSLTQYLSSVSVPTQIDFIMRWAQTLFNFLETRPVRTTGAVQHFSGMMQPLPA